MTKLNHTILLLLIASTIFSQKICLEVKVLDQDSIQVSGSDFFIEQTNELLASDQNGTLKVYFDGPTVVDYTLFSMQYQTVYGNLYIEKDTSIRILVSPLSFTLSDVEIIERKKELFMLRSLNDVEGTSIYSGKKSEVVIMDLVNGNLALNNARQIYAQVSGLNIYEGNEGGLQLSIGGRGLDPNRTSNFNTRQNGYDISADVLGYPESYYTPPSQAIEEIQVIRGASSLQYGTQFGGLINFKLRSIPSFKKYELRAAHTIGSFGLNDTYLSGGININKWTVDGYFNHKTGNGYRKNSSYNSLNGRILIAYKSNSWGTLSGELTKFNYLAQQAGGLTDEQFDLNPRQSTRARNWFGVDWTLYQFKYDYEWNENVVSLQAFGLDASRNSLGFRGNPKVLNQNPITALDEQNSDGTYLLPRDLIMGDFNNIGLEGRFLTNTSLRKQKLTSLIGFKIYSSDNTSRQGAGSKDDDPDFTFYDQQYDDYPNQSNYLFPNLNLALFTEHIFRINQKLSISPGARLEYIRTAAQGSYKQSIFDNAGNLIRQNTLSEDLSLPRTFALLGLGIDYKINATNNVFANVSQNYRSITFSDIRTVNPSFIIDPNIKDEKGFTLDLGAKGRLNKFLNYNIGLYSIIYNNRIGIILDNRANRVRTNIGTAVIGGVEALIDLDISRWVQPERKYWSFNTFINAALTDSRYLSSSLANIDGNKVEFIPFLNLKSGINARYKSWNGSFQLTYLTNQYTDAQNSPVAEVGNAKSGLIGPIPDYAIFDISLTYRWKYFTISSGINNLLDNAYFTRRATGYPGPGIIPSDGRSLYLTCTFDISR